MDRETRRMRKHHGDREYSWAELLEAAYYHEGSSRAFGSDGLRKIRGLEQLAIDELEELRAKE